MVALIGFGLMNIGIQAGTTYSYYYGSLVKIDGGVISTIFSSSLVFLTILQRRFSLYNILGSLMIIAFVSMIYLKDNFSID